MFATYVIMETRQVLAALAVATLVLGAGCSGLLGSSESTATPATATNGTESTPNYATANGSLDVAAALAMHNDTVRSTGTFTREGSISGILTTTMRANATSGDVFVTIEPVTGETSTAAYVDESGTQYTRQVTGSGTNYSVIEAGDSSSSTNGWRVAARPDETPISSAIVTEISAITWTHQGETTYEGTTVDRFTASGFNATSQYDAAAASSFSAALLVEPDRGIRKLNTTVVQTDRTGSERTFSTVVRYSKFGSTTVEEPDWLDEARAQATDG